MLGFFLKINFQNDRVINHGGNNEKSFFNIFFGFWDIEQRKNFVDARPIFIFRNIFFKSSKKRSREIKVNPKINDPKKDYKFKIRPAEGHENDR